MKRLILAILLSFLIFNGCAARLNKVMGSWVDHHYGDLIASWGPPQEVFDDGYGGRILVYTTYRQWTSPGTSKTGTTGSATMWDGFIWGSTRSKTTYQPSQTYGWTAYRMFWINKDGIIYRWSWQGF